MTLVAPVVLLTSNSGVGGVPRILEMVAQSRVVSPRLGLAPGSPTLGDSDKSTLTIPILSPNISSSSGQAGGRGRS